MKRTAPRHVAPGPRLESPRRSAAKGPNRERLEHTRNAPHSNARHSIGKALATALGRESALYGPERFGRRFGRTCSVDDCDERREARVPEFDSGSHGTPPSREKPRRRKSDKDEVPSQGVLSKGAPKLLPLRWSFLGDDGRFPEAWSLLSHSTVGAFHHPRRRRFLRLSLIHISEPTRPY